MNKATLLFLTIHLFLRATASAGPEFHTGQLQETSSGKYSLITENGSVPVVVAQPAASAVSSLIGKSPYVQVHGGVFENESLKTNQVPTLVSGNRVLEGRLVKTIKQGVEGYQIDGQAVQFGRTKKVNGTEFDVKSRQYFIGKEVRVVGNIKDSIFVIESILRNDVFSAEETAFADAEIPAKILRAFGKNPAKAAVQMVEGKLDSPSPGWFRKTLATKTQQPVRVGDPVLLISASGGQGDSMGSVNGHLAVGIGYVGADFKIEGEMFNVYVTNEKEIVPGNVELNDYFGHLVSGQQNYRPTYTLAFYGLEESKLLKVKQELDRFHPLFRSGNTKITSVKNCATLSIQALADIGFYGPQRNDRNGEGEFRLLSTQTEFPPESFLAEVRFVSKTKRAEFMPGPALQSFIENLPYLLKSPELGITRVDFIFAGQTPSYRLFGGAPTTGVAQQLKQQGVVEAGVLVHKLKTRIKPEN